MSKFALIAQPGHTHHGRALPVTRHASSVRWAHFHCCTARLPMTPASSASLESFRANLVQHLAWTAQLELTPPVWALRAETHVLSARRARILPRLAHLPTTPAWNASLENTPVNLPRSRARTAPQELIHLMRGLLAITPASDVQWAHSRTLKAQPPWNSVCNAKSVPFRQQWGAHFASHV